MSIRLSTLGRGGRFKGKHKGAGTSTRLPTRVSQRHHRSLPASCLLTGLTGDKTGSAFLSISRSPRHRFLPLNQGVTEMDASSITTITLGSLPPHPHGRHPSRLPTFRGDKAPHIYVHPTEGAHTSFSQMRIALTAHVCRAAASRA